MYDGHPPHHMQQASEQHCAPLIHAPIPISAYSTLLPHVQCAQEPSVSAKPVEAGKRQEDVARSHPVIISLSPAPEPSQTSNETGNDGHHLPQASVDAVSPAQLSYPSSPVQVPELAQSWLHPAAPPFLDVHTPFVEASASSTPCSSTASPSQTIAKSKNRPKIPTTLQPAMPGKPENIRKSYFRSVADNVGFQPTDPDTITSHDKKRHYLECLEQYIMWLHNQIGLSGHTPLQLERVDSYQGLDIRSIRTLLVHMQTQTRRLHLQVTEEEQKYFDLETQALSQSSPDPQGVLVADSAASASPPERTRRHSIANGMIPMCASSHVPPLPSAMVSSQTFVSGSV